MIDIDYYLSQQIHPVSSRLCASIQGTSPERLADCLGLDSSKVILTGQPEFEGNLCSILHTLCQWYYYIIIFFFQFQSKSSGAVSNDPANALLFAVDDKER